MIIYVHWKNEFQISLNSDLCRFLKTPVMTIHMACYNWHLLVFHLFNKFNSISNNQFACNFNLYSAVFQIVPSCNQILFSMFLSSSFQIVPIFVKIRISRTMCEFYPLSQIMWSSNPDTCQFLGIILLTRSFPIVHIVPSLIIPTFVLAPSSLPGCSKFVVIKIYLIFSLKLQKRSPSNDYGELKSDWLKWSRWPIASLADQLIEINFLNSWIIDNLCIRWNEIEYHVRLIFKNVKCEIQIKIGNTNRRSCFKRREE